MKIAELQKATALIQKMQDLEALKADVLTREPSFLDHGKPKPIGKLQLTEKQHTALAEGMKEAVQGFFAQEIGLVLDELEAIGIETGRGK